LQNLFGDKNNTKFFGDHIFLIFEYPLLQFKKNGDMNKEEEEKGNCFRFSIQTPNKGNK